MLWKKREINGEIYVEIKRSSFRALSYGIYAFVLIIVLFMFDFIRDYKYIKEKQKSVQEKVFVIEKKLELIKNEIGQLKK
ncbi:MAG: hypothetical protein WHV67_10510 [Thermoanaerobaculia bacterium]